MRGPASAFLVENVKRQARYLRTHGLHPQRLFEVLISQDLYEDVRNELDVTDGPLAKRLHTVLGYKISQIVPSDHFENTGDWRAIVFVNYPYRWIMADRIKLPKYLRSRETFLCHKSKLTPDESSTTPIPEPKTSPLVT